MSDISARWLGGTELAAAFAEHAARAELAARDAVAGTCDVIAASARPAAPVRRGELRDSIAVEVHGTSGTVTASSGHAGYVENGTRYMGAEPFMRPALADGEVALPDLLAAGMEV